MRTAGVGKSDTTHSVPASGPNYKKSKLYFIFSVQGVVKNHRVAGARVLTPVPLVLYLTKNFNHNKSLAD